MYLYFQRGAEVRSPEVCQTAIAKDDVRQPYLIFSDKRAEGISAGRQGSELTAEVYQKKNIFSCSRQCAALGWTSLHHTFFF